MSDLLRDDTVLLMGSALRKIQRLPLAYAEEGWQSLSEKLLEEDTSLENTFLNSPMAMAFDHDASNVAVAYRGFPLTVWNLEMAEPISRCKRSSPQRSTSGAGWTGVNRVVWHPNSGDVLGIYSDGVIFKWNLHERGYQELKSETNGSIPFEVQCSPDGAVFATNDADGAVKLYRFDHFALIYQLSSEDMVTSLCFSPEGKRFYDLRGSFCTAWEPNALIRLSETDERSSDADTIEHRSMTVSYLSSEAFVEPLAPVITLAARSQGGLVCTGNDEGVIELHEITSGRKLEIGRSAAGLSINHLTWSEDGQYFAYVELTGRVVVKSVMVNPEVRSALGWKNGPTLSVKPGLGKSFIHQLLFSLDS